MYCMSRGSTSHAEDQTLCCLTLLPPPHIILVSCISCFGRIIRLISEALLNAPRGVESCTYSGPLPLSLVP